MQFHVNRSRSTFKILHDLISDRREPGWFLSIIIFYALVREDRVFGIILGLYLIFINIITILADKCIGFRIYYCKVFILQVVYVGSFFPRCFFVVDGFCYGRCGIPYFVAA